MSWLNNRRALAYTTLVVAFVFLLGINALSNNVFRSASVDLTEDRLYSLSSGTHKVLTEMDEPVTLRFFLSPKLAQVVPAYAVYAARVRNVLRRFAKLSNGKIRLEEYQPVAFSVEEDRAVAYGLRGVPVDQSGELVFFGLAGTNTTDDQKTVAFFHPSRERFIEFDLTRLIRSLSTPKKKIVGLISSLPIQGRFSMRGMVRPWAVYTQIRDQFDVRPLTAPKKIPKDIDVLMIVHPFALPDPTLYAIDQFVLKGGKLIVLVDPVPEAAPRRRTMFGQGPIPPGSDMPKLFKTWGIELVGRKVVGDIESAVRVRTQFQGRSVVAPYVVWIDLGATSLNRQDKVTKGLRRTILATAGALRKLKGATTKLTPLIWTRKHASLIDINKVRFRPDVVKLYQSYRTDRRAYVVAARITGQATTAFPKGNPVKPKKKAEKKSGKKADGDAKKKAATASKKAGKKKAKKPEKPVHLMKATKPIDVIVVADVDWLTQGYWQSTTNFFGERITVPTSDNANFIMNALDTMSGVEAFTGLRAKGTAQRPFTKIEALKKKAEEKQRATRGELVKELAKTRKELKDARTRSKGGKLVLTADEQKKIEEFRHKLLRIRRDLRLVKFEEQKDIEREQTRWMRINIGLMPLMICAIALVVVVARQRRRRRKIVQS